MLRSGKRRRQMRVLIVDDHQVIWSGMRGVVERLAAQHQSVAPFEWHATLDVGSALTLELPADALDLILLDFHLPDISGLTAMHALRQRFDSAPIVILSGDQQPQKIRAAIEAGAAGYIPKTMRESEM